MFFAVSASAVASMHLVFNEQAKLTAAWLNALATALITAGAFAPMAAILYGLAALNISIPRLAFASIGCFVAGLGLHLVALYSLRRLRE